MTAMPIPIVLLAGLTMMQSVHVPPPILYIAREPLLAGGEKEYRKIEEETARLAMKLGCPHPYLAMESLTGAKEIWWFNGFDSPEEQKQVGESYQKDTPFSAMIKRNAERKAQVIGKVSEIVTHYRADLSSGDPWVPGHARFVVISSGRDNPSRAGTVFQAADGVLFVFSPARTREQADHLAAAVPGSVIVTIRASYSVPAKDWIARDPELWRGGAR